MVFKVLLFASYAEALGTTTVDVELPVGATVRDVVERVRARPGAERLPPMPMIAVNQCYATAGQQLAHGDEIAIIPPVAGG